MAAQMERIVTTTTTMTVDPPTHFLACSYCFSPSRRLNSAPPPLANSMVSAIDASMMGYTTLVAPLPR